MRYFYVLFNLNFYFIFSFLNSQIDPTKIDIIRDNFGVPHIFAETDAEVSYGLAWAHAEDDFKTIQLSFLAGNNLLSKHIGRKGIPADFISQLINSKEFVSENYYKKISPEFRKIVEGYAQGLNSYASKNPAEVLLDDLFPINPNKMMNYAYLQLFISSRGDYWIKKILENDFNSINFPINNRGSNTFAFNSKKTIDGKTYFTINTHQPLDGPVSWYEAHLCSEEGTNIIGALFAGSPIVLTGTNESLSWAHTVNKPDKTDVYKLKMHKTKKNIYEVDGSYLKLEVNKAEFYIKLLGIPIKIKKKYYRSIFGPTIKNSEGFYSIRTPSLFEIRALEQWWRMNKANSFSEFYEILKMKALPGYNIGYADKNDTIFYISNGLIPKREPGYNWKSVVPGNTTKTLWNSTYDTEELPQIIQPKSGYFYNANHSPFKSTDGKENPNSSNFSSDMGFELYDNNRSIRIKEIIDGQKKFSYDDFKKLKFDNKLPDTLNYSWMDINQLFKIIPNKYPDISQLIKRIQDWDKKANINSLGAGAFLIFYHRLRPYFQSIKEPKKFTEDILIKALYDTKKFMLDNFGKIDIRLGEYQKLIRGKKVLPIFGMPDVITAMSSIPYKNGRVKVVSGESYIQLVIFDDNGPQIESIISYGSSDHPESKHYDDQMDLFQKQKLKKMSLDKDEIYKSAVKKYNPN